VQGHRVTAGAASDRTVICELRARVRAAGAHQHPAMQPKCDMQLTRTTALRCLIFMATGWPCACDARDPDSSSCSLCGQHTSRAYSVACAVAKVPAAPPLGSRWALGVSPFLSVATDRSTEWCYTSLTTTPAMRATIARQCPSTIQV
jgi:hypothetical protein